MVRFTCLPNNAPIAWRPGQVIRTARAFRCTNMDHHSKKTLWILWCGDDFKIVMIEWWYFIGSAAQQLIDSPQYGIHTKSYGEERRNPRFPKCGGHIACRGHQAARGVHQHCPHMYPYTDGHCYFSLAVQGLQTMS